MVLVGVNSGSGELWGTSKNNNTTKIWSLSRLLLPGARICSQSVRKVFPGVSFRQIIFAQAGHSQPLVHIPKTVGKLAQSNSSGYCLEKEL